MLRKQVSKAISAAPMPTSDAIDIAAVATVLVTSEEPGPLVAPGRRAY
jgi:hypothetical protein